MNCGDWEERIALHAGGDLPAGGALEVERHVAECAGCRVLLSGLRESLQQMRAAHDQAIEPAHFAAVRARVLAELERGRRPWWRQTWLYAAVAAALVIFTGLRWGGGMSSRSAPASSARSVGHPAPSGPESAATATEAPVAPREQRRKPAPRRRDTGKLPLREQKPAETVLVKLETNNPDVVIYWIAESKGEPK